MNKIPLTQKLLCVLMGLLCFLGVCVWGRDKKAESHFWQQSALEQYYNLLPSLKSDAARKQALDTLDLLQHYQKTGDVNFRNEAGRTLLAMAVLGNDEKLVKDLTSIDSLADVNLADNGGWTPLMLACYNDFEPIAQHLLSRGALVNVQQEAGDTALHLTCKNQNIRLIKQLIDVGAKISICNKKGQMAQDLIDPKNDPYYILQILK